MQKTLNLQDSFLNQARKGEIPVTVFLMNGYQLRGTVKSFDSYTVILDSQGKQQLIYKHAISTVAPLQNINYQTEHEE